MQKIIRAVTAGVFLAVIFGFSLAFLILPDKTFSEQENRSLRTFPKFTFEKLASGKFSSEINEYFADQFPLRDLFVGVKGVAETAMLKGENDGVLLGRDGQLAKRDFDVCRADGSVTGGTDGFDRENLIASCGAINRLSDSLEIPFSVFLTGRTLDVAASAFSYPDAYGNELTALLRENLSPDVSYIDAVPLYRSLYDAGEYVYYKTDHHWTTLGAYYGYVEVMKSFGMESEILPPEAFEKEVVSEEFYGTTWSAGGMKFVSPDTMEFWHAADESRFTVTADGKLSGGFYNREYLQKKDKYAAFLDGTHEVVTVTDEGEDRPTLLLFKDSFANSLAPFLAEHFDLVLLNLSSTRTDYTDVTRYAKEYSADAVLLVYTLGNVVSTNTLNTLR